MDSSPPVIRLRLWLETPEGVFFGSGRAQLLAGIARHGSLNAAARGMGLSSRAALAKLRKTEEILGFKIVEKKPGRGAPLSLTAFGELLVERFDEWFARVEAEAERAAAEIFPWQSVTYDRRDEPAVAKTKGLGVVAPLRRSA